MVLVLAVLVACRCAKVQGLELLSDLLDRMRPRPSDAKATPPVDRRAACTFRGNPASLCTV